jgi:metal-responsive CopG/Arc/MetJ family transcriptional regulator
MKLSDEPMRPICITLPPWLIDRLDEIARQELSNRSAIIRRQTGARFSGWRCRW